MFCAVLTRFLYCLPRRVRALDTPPSTDCSVFVLCCANHNSLLLVQEGEGTRYSPLALTVTDADAAPNNGPFRYEILEGDVTDQFSISDKGLLMAHGVFDMKVKNKFLLKVRHNLVYVLVNTLVDQIIRLISNTSFI